jgi:arsenite methyltransferase
MTNKHTSDDIRSAVRKHYADAITGKTSCCGAGPSNADTPAGGRYAELAGYSPEELMTMPDTVTTFGCGNPVNVAQIRPGQTVLDLGSGAGLDLILAAKKVGPSGKVIGLDMTPQMIEAATDNLKKAGVPNYEIRLGEMEEMPVADGEVDWIISNCVINLSPEKERVFAEAFRVLKPGGRILVSDIVAKDLPQSVRDDMAAWAACVSGAVEESEYIRLVTEAGFVDVQVVDRLVYDAGSARAMFGDGSCCSPQPQPLGPRKQQGAASSFEDYANRIASIKLSARKPAG